MAKIGFILSAAALICTLLTLLVRDVMAHPVTCVKGVSGYYHCYDKHGAPMIP